MIMQNLLIIQNLLIMQNLAGPGPRGEKEYRS